MVGQHFGLNSLLVNVKVEVRIPNGALRVAVLRLLCSRDWSYRVLSRGRGRKRLVKGLLVVVQQLGRRHLCLVVPILLYILNCLVSGQVNRLVDGRIVLVESNLREEVFTRVPKVEWGLHVNVLLLRGRL